MKKKLTLLFTLMAWAVLACGCSTCPPCLPEIEIQEKLVPNPCVVVIDVLEKPVDEPYPPFNEVNSKDWSLEVGRIEKENRIRREKYEEALELQIAHNNESEIQCK